MRTGLWHAARLRVQVYDIFWRSRRLPPGSLRAACLRNATTDDRFYLKHLRRHGPIFKLFWGSGHLKICVVGFSLGRHLLNQHRGALRLVNTTDITSLVPAEYLRSMNPETHPKYRRLFKGAFRGDLAAARESELRGIFRCELARLADGVRMEPTAAAKLYSTLDSTVMSALLLLVLGVRTDSPIASALADWYRRLGPDGRVAMVGPEQAAAFHAIRTIVLQLVQSMEHDNSARIGDSILKRLVHAGSDTIDETVIGNAIYMVERGRHDMRDLLRWVIKYLSDHPSLIAELRAGLANPQSNSRLAEACVLETLRLDQAELLGRTALQSFTFEGFRVPKNSWVGILIRESHRDPDTFNDPDSYCPHRFLERTYSSDEYSPFGIDEHQCIAASLVVRLGALFVEELVQGFSWTVTADGPRRHGHLHWEPSPSFAIEIRPNQ
jgi:cytochrome P450